MQLLTSQKKILGPVHLHPKTNKWDYLRSPIMKKKLFLVLTLGKFLESLGSGIGTGSIFCLSFSLSNRVYLLKNSFLARILGWLYISFTCHKTTSHFQNKTKISLLIKPYTIRFLSILPLHCTPPLYNTPSRTSRISGLKSQILKPPFLS